MHDPFVRQFNRLAVICLLWLSLSVSCLGGELSSDAGDGSPVLGEPYRLSAQLGLEVHARQGPCQKLRCSFPVPLDWPEQQVTELRRDATANVAQIKVIAIDDGVGQVQFSVPRLRRGESAKVVFEFSVLRRKLAPPAEPKGLVKPVETDAALRRFLLPSPFIETKSAAVKQAAARIPLDDDMTDWQRAKAIWDFTQATIDYSGVKALKGAKQAIEDGDGDCEERTSVFVAFCRLQGIPARSVWIPGHAYAEFYLEEKAGRGHWYPAESVGGLFGHMGTGFLVLQKGDNFRDPLKRGRQRYITETAKGQLTRGGAAPTLKSIQIVDITPAVGHDK